MDKQLLIKGFIDSHFPNAPEHLTSSLRKELDKLDIATLQILGFSFLSVSRICRIIEIGKAIKDAQDKGLYEVAEHLTSEIDLEE
jgi:hypothetical protein